MCIVHVSLVPIIGVVGEQKTKPTQHSVAVLRSLGLSPHLLACRCSEPLDDGVRQKLVRACVWGRGGGRADGGCWGRDTTLPCVSCVYEGPSPLPAPSLSDVIYD